MSSTSYARLRRIFNTKTTTPTKPPTKKSKTPKKPPTSTTTVTSPSKPKKLAFEPLPMFQLTDSLTNLKLFIDKFKKASNTGQFRYSYKYYDDVVTHLARGKQHYYIEQILEHQKQYETDMAHEPFVCRLIALYGKSRMYNHARKVFDEMPDRNCPRSVLSANALLTACVNSRRLSNIPGLFRELREELGIQPDDVSYNVVIKAFCEMEDTDAALKVADEMERNGCRCDLYTYNTILDALYKTGDVSKGDEVWEVMKTKNLEPDIRSYNARVRGLVADKRVTEAVWLLDEMRGNGVNPDVYTYNGLINGFVKEGDLVEVKKWYEEMVRNEIDPDLITFRMIIAFACKKGDYKLGFEMSKEGLKKGMNVGRLNLQAVLEGLVKESDLDEAKELVELVDGSKFIHYKLKFGR